MNVMQIKGVKYICDAAIFRAILIRKQSKGRNELIWNKMSRLLGFRCVCSTNRIFRRDLQQELGNNAIMVSDLLPRLDQGLIVFDGVN